MERLALCALVLLQILYHGECYRGISRKLDRSHQASAKNADNTDILRSYLIHRDSVQPGAKSPSERFLNAVKRSYHRVNHLENNLNYQVSVTPEMAPKSESPVSASSGEYVMEFALGTPPQKFSTIVDTGSDLSWVQCAPCSRCFQQPEPLFNPTASSSYFQTICNHTLCREGFPQVACNTRTPCNYTYSYGDGSTSRGVLSFDTITFGLTSAKTTSSPITFGNAPANSKASYTPLLSNAGAPTYYYLGVEGITIGGKRVQIPASAFEISDFGTGGVILDSGTTISYWTTAAFLPILSAFQEQISYPETDASMYNLNLCYNISNVANSSLTLPTMVVHFTNVDLKLQVSSLFMLVEDAGHVVCLAMGASEQFSIIGNIQQQNHLIVHDVEHRRVGFLSAQCDAL